MTPERNIRFRTPRFWTNVYPIHVELNAAHWDDAPWTADGLYSDGSLRYKGVQHDAAPRPWQWPWWQIAVFSLLDLSPTAPNIAKRLWIYTRWGTLFAQFNVDRRGDRER